MRCDHNIPTAPCLTCVVQERDEALLKLEKAKFELEYWQRQGQEASISLAGFRYKLEQSELQNGALRKVIGDAVAAARKVINSYGHGEECPTNGDCMDECEEDCEIDHNTRDCECSTGEMHRVLDILLASPPPPDYGARNVTEKRVDPYRQPKGKDILGAIPDLPEVPGELTCAVCGLGFGPFNQVHTH